MRHALPRVWLALLVLAAFSAVASADTFGVGILTLDPSSTGTGDEFDIQNLTGSAALGAPTDFTVATALTFDTVSLTVDFADGTSETLDASDFASDGFGGFDGTGSFDLAGDPITEAILTGTLSPTSVTLTDGTTTETLAGTYSATLTDPSGTLAEFDAVEIDASTAAVVTSPEPGSELLLAAGLLSLLGMAWRRKQSRPWTNKALIAS
jgi:hypothetical protein